MITNFLKGNKPGAEGIHNKSSKEGVVVYHEKNEIRVASLPGGDRKFPPGPLTRRVAPGPAQRLGRSWHSVNPGGMNGPSVSEGRAVPVIGEGVSSGKIMIFLFKKWGFKRIYSVIWSISLCGTNPSFPRGQEE